MQERGTSSLDRHVIVPHCEYATEVLAWAAEGS